MPLAEPEEIDQIEEEEKPEGAWAQEWIIMAHRLVDAGMTLPLPVPESDKHFSPLPDILPFAPYVASLYRYSKRFLLSRSIRTRTTGMNKHFLFSLLCLGPLSLIARMNFKAWFSLVTQAQA